MNPVTKQSERGAQHSTTATRPHRRRDDFPTPLGPCNIQVHMFMPRSRCERATPSHPLPRTITNNRPRGGTISVRSRNSGMPFGVRHVKPTQDSPPPGESKVRCSAWKPVYLAFNSVSVSTRWPICGGAQPHIRQLLANTHHPETTHPRRTYTVGIPCQPTEGQTQRQHRLHCGGDGDKQTNCRENTVRCEWRSSQLLGFEHGDCADGVSGHGPDRCGEGGEQNKRQRSVDQSHVLLVQTMENRVCNRLLIVLSLITIATLNQCSVKALRKEHNIH